MIELVRVEKMNCNNDSDDRVIVLTNQICKKCIASKSRKENQLIMSVKCLQVHRKPDDISNHA